MPNVDLFATISAVTGDGRHAVVRLDDRYDGRAHGVIDEETEGRIALMNRDPRGRLREKTRIRILAVELGSEALRITKVSALEPGVNRIADGPERAEMLALGDRLYDLIPMEEKRRHKGERVAIDLRTGEYRFFPYHVRGQELAVTGPTWTSVVRIPEVDSDIRRDH